MPSPRRTLHAFLCLICLLLLRTSLDPPFVRAQEKPQGTKHDSPSVKPETPSPVQSLKDYGQLPLAFEPNVGQTDKTIRYLSRSAYGELQLKDTEAVLSLRGNRAEDHQQQSSATLRIRFAGAKGPTGIAGEEPLDGTSNYLVGNDSTKWHTHVPNYKRVRYGSLYPGIDLVFYGNGRLLEHDFVVSPGADYRQIAIGIEGARRVHVDKAGRAVITSKAGQVQFSAPTIYQVRDGERINVGGGFRRAGKQLRFRVEQYDKALPLVIDPVLSFSTYIAGGQSESGSAIAVDAAGNTYVAGYTFSTDYPTKNPLQPDCKCGNGPDVFITKLNANGTALIWSTFIGGSDYDQVASIALDGNGNVIVGGWTSSNDFPLKNGLTIGNGFGNTQGFLSSLAPDGASFNFSTLLGGTSGASIYAVATDGAGNVYAAGGTYSSDFPVGSTNTIIGTPPQYPISDIFVAKLTPTGNLKQTTFIGPDPAQMYYTSFSIALGNGLALDASGNIFLAGRTTQGFPVTPGSFQSTSVSTQNLGFVAKLKPDGSAFVYATYLGGTGVDEVKGLTVDAAGNAFAVGDTSSTDFPTTPGAFLTTFPTNPFGFSCCQLFVSKLNATGTALLYSTYLGAPFTSLGFGTIATGIAIDGAGEAFVTGITSNASFPLKNPLQGTLPAGQFGGDDPASLVTELNSAGSALLFSTLFSGSTSAQAAGIAVEHANNAKKVYVTGTAYDNGLTTTPGAFQGSVPPAPPFIQTSHVFVTEFDLAIAAASVCPNQNQLFLQGKINTDSETTTLVLKNCGNASLTISGVQVSGIFTQTNTCQNAVAPGLTCAVKVGFHPTERGAYSGSLTISSNSGIKQLVIPIQGTAVAPIVQINTSQLTLDSQLVGLDGAPAPIFVSNVGDGELDIATIRVSGPDFKVDGSECGNILEPGNFCLIFVTFHPLAAGQRNGTVTIIDDAADSPQTVTLQGTGITVYPAPALSSIDPAMLQEKTDQQLLQVAGVNFFPASQIRINGVPVATYYSSPTNLSATVPVNVLQNLGTLKIDVITSAPGGGVTSSLETLIYGLAPVTANDIIYEPYTRQIYLSIPSSNSTNPNTIVTFDPVRETFGPYLPTGNNPDRLALSQGSEMLYVGLDGDHAVQQYNLKTGKPGFLTAMPVERNFGESLLPWEMHPLSGRPQDFVTSLRFQGSPSQGGVTLVTNGTLRNTFFAENSQQAAVDSLCSLSDPATFYGYDLGEIVRFTVRSDNTLQLTPQSSLPQQLSQVFACDSKFLYDLSGNVVDPVANKIAGKYTFPGFSFGASVIPDPVLHRTFYLTSAFANLLAYDQKTFALVGSLSFPNNLQPFRMVRWGSDGFAFLSFPQGLIYFRSTLAQSPAATNPKPRLKSVEPQVRQNNGNFQLTVEGHDFVLGSVVRWNNDDRTTIYVSDKELIADIPNADVSQTGSATITVFNPPAGGGVSNAVSYVINEPALVSIAITPANAAIVKGKALQFVATGTYTDGNLRDITSSVAWSSSSNKVAAITTGGLASGLAAGISTITGSIGKISGSGPLLVYVGNFTEALSAQTATVVTGKTISVKVTISAVSGFNADVSLSAVGLPGGSTVTFSPMIVKNGAGTSTMTIATTKATATGLFSVTVIAGAGSLQHVSQLVLGVNSSLGDFSVSANPNLVTFFAGSDGTATTIVITPSGGFTGDVALSASGPAGSILGFDFGNPVVGGSGSSPLFLEVPSNLTPGNYTLQITATSGAIVHTLVVPLTIQSLPN